MGYLVGQEDRGHCNRYSECPSKLARDQRDTRFAQIYLSR